MACNAERNAYIVLKSELTDLQEQLKRAATPQNSGLIQQINALRPQVAAAQHVYEVCAAAHPPPAPLSARFQGNATVSFTDSGQKKTSVVPVDSMWTFSGEGRSNVTINSISALPQFPPKVTIEWLSGNGSYRADTNALELTLIFMIHATITVVFTIHQDIPLVITLTSAPPSGQVIDAAGHLRLFGSTVVDGGLAGKYPVEITLDGTITPRP